MGERAQKVVIRNGTVEKYWSQWGGQSCPEILLDGPKAIDEDLGESKRTDDWMDAVFAEGGYLVDFDQRSILVYSWDRDLIRGLIEDLRSAWPGWSVVAANEGVPDFQSYLEHRGIK